MKTKLSHSVGLAALTYAGVLLSGYVVAEGRNLDESCVPNIIGDGHCDQSQNTETCGTCRESVGRKWWYQNQLEGCCAFK